VATENARSFFAEAHETGQRLDRVVAARFPELSRTRVQELIAANLIMLDGRPVKGSHKVRAGQRVDVEPKQRPPVRAEAEEIPLDILYEDDDVIAVNKPAGMTVHAGAGNLRGTLVNALLGRGQALAQANDLLRPGIVHRLDKETSGVLLVAKNDASHAKLGEAFRSRAVQKTYIALIEGVLPQKGGRIELPIGRDPKRRTRMAVVRAKAGSAALRTAREARTDWHALARIDSTTLVEVQLHTGRTHQIRVHFSALKHPIVGDALYGAARLLRVEKIALPSLGRNFLHAAKIQFAHPRTSQPMELRAPLPVELRGYLNQLATAAGEEPQCIDAALAGYL